MVDVWRKTLLIASLPLLLFADTSRWSSISESCSPFKDQYSLLNTCDPYAHLVCDRDILVNDYRCKCKSPELIWASSVVRCTLRLGSSCYHLQRIGAVPGTEPDCPPSSYCDGGTCKCHTNMKPLPDGSGCSTAFALPPPPPLALLLTSVAALLIHHSR